MSSALADGMIDVHTHVTPVSLPECHDASLAWPCMLCSAGEHELRLGDKPFRKLDARSWDAERRCEDMDRDGVAVQVLSPMPELLSYWFPAREAERIADHMNAAIADMVARNPRRFRGLGMAPLQDVDRATRYMEQMRARFGLSGVEIGSNINGALLGEPQLAPIFETAAASGLAIFVHALHPVATKHVAGGEAMAPFVGFPVDVAMSAASLIMAGAGEKWSSLRLAFSHGGGALGSLLGRLDQGWRSFPALRANLPSPPSAYARRFFYDSNVYDAQWLRHLAQQTAPGQVIVGTDYPYPIMQMDPAGYLKQAALTDAELADVRRQAALRFLNEA